MVLLTRHGGGRGQGAARVQGRPYLLEHALPADYAFLRVHQADRLGNCTVRGIELNFNLAMAMAARVASVEAEEVVEPGALDPRHVAIPGIFVQRVAPVGLTDTVFLNSLQAARGKGQN